MPHSTLEKRRAWHRAYAKRPHHCFISIRIARSMHRELHEAAHEEGCSVRELIRTYIEWGLENGKQ